MRNREIAAHGGCNLFLRPKSKERATNTAFRWGYGVDSKIKMGDPDAWDILVHKYYDSVYFYCVRRCYGDCDIASDLTQDIFLKLVESLPRYRFIGKFQNYLYTMAVNTCNNYLKKRHIE